MISITKFLMSVVLLTSLTAGAAPATAALTESEFLDFERGFLTEEEAQFAMWPDLNDYLRDNGMVWNVGTYGRPRGSDLLRLQDLWAHLDNEKLQYFRMLLLYNVSETGPYAQTVRVYTRPPGSQFNYVDLKNWRYDAIWDISSGVISKFRTITGLYKVHPDRVVRDATAWGANDPMPHSMYIHYKYCPEGRWSGIATHGTPFENRLGNRASSGCLRLSRTNARDLYTEVTKSYAGDVPVTNFCNGSRWAPGAEHLEMARDAQGRVQLESGYQVMFVIHDDPNPAF